MKRKLSFILLLTAFILFTGNQICLAQSNQTNLPHSMKGYELFSWRIRGNWYFSLVPGTNRQKSYQEVTAPKVRVKGVGELKKKLALLPKGEEIFWSTHRIPKMSLPPERMVSNVIDYCRKTGVVLTVAAENFGT